MTSIRQVDYRSGGIVSVTDAALGNVTSDGRIDADPGMRVHSQSAYAILLGDPTLVSGKAGRFNLLDYRSHRIARVCRSSYASETLRQRKDSMWQSFVAVCWQRLLVWTWAWRQLGLRFAKFLWLVSRTRRIRSTGWRRMLALARRSPSLLLCTASIRQQLKRPNTMMRWTATANNFVDAGTISWWIPRTSGRSSRKANGRSSTRRSSRSRTRRRGSLVMKFRYYLVNHWKQGTVDYSNMLDTLVNPWMAYGGHGGRARAHGAKSFRSPQPRFSLASFPLRTILGEFNTGSLPTWRVLEEYQTLKDLSNMTAVLDSRARRLVSFSMAPRIPRPHKIHGAVKWQFMSLDPCAYRVSRRPLDH